MRLPQHVSCPSSRLIQIVSRCRASAADVLGASVACRLSAPKIAKNAAARAESLAMLIVEPTNGDQISPMPLVGQPGSGQR